MALAPLTDHARVRMQQRGIPAAAEIGPRVIAAVAAPGAT